MGVELRCGRSPAGARGTAGRGPARTAWSGALLSWALAGCAHGATALDAEQEPGGAAPGLQQADTPAARASASLEDDDAALSLSAPERIDVGVPAAAELSIEGRGDYHVNDEYPIRIVVRASPALRVTRPQLDQSDAAELNAERARFELPFSCEAAGGHRIELDVEFAVCTATTCVPQARSIALELQAR